jgi:DNA-binding CsgD family transcriptional regulator
MGLESTALADAVRRLYAEVAAPGAGGIDLNVLRECIGAEHVVMTSMHDGDTEWRACTQFGQVEERELGQWLTMADHESLVRLTASGLPVRTSTFLSRRAMASTELYQEVLRPLNGGLAAVSYWREHDGWRGLSYCRSLESGHDFREDELASIQALVPHLRTIEQLHAQLRQRTRASVDAAHDMLNLAPQAVLLLDAAGRVVFLNRSASALLAQPGCGLRADREGLRARDGAEDRRLQQAVRLAAELAPESRRAALSDGAVAAQGLPVTIRRALPLRPLILSIVPAASLSAQAEFGSARVAVMVHNAGTDGTIAAARLVEAYGLTAREAELAVLLGKGEDLAGAAGLMALSAGTARQYLKQIFAKLGVQRQAELVRLLVASFPQE